MANRTLKIEGGTIKVKTGTYGPAHDPYAFTEYTVERKGRKKAVLHMGIGVWSEIAGKRLVRNYRNKYEVQERREIARFEKACGMMICDIEIALNEDEASQGFDYADVCAAERCAGWDPNP